ncbi:16155_t:CDS:2, partial [Racocetra fulgida]
NVEDEDNDDPKDNVEDKDNDDPKDVQKLLANVTEIFDEENLKKHYNKAYDYDEEIEKLIKSKNEKKILDYFKKCFKPCKDYVMNKGSKQSIQYMDIKEMIKIAVLIPRLVEESYDSVVAEIMWQLTYVKVPVDSDNDKWMQKLTTLLFPSKLSPFAKLIVLNPSELLSSKESYREIYRSPPFRAIVKF